MNRLRHALALLALVGATSTAATQEIRESDLFLSDPANLSRLVDEAALALRQGQPEATRAKLATVAMSVGDRPAKELEPLVARAHLLDAELLLVAGKRTDAGARIESALRLVPSVTPVDGASKRFLKLYRQIHAKTIGLLDVHSSPVGATVSVDGRILGNTPLEHHPLPTGLHFVKIARAGHAAEERVVDIRARKTARLESTLERKSATFLLVTNAAGARVTLDDVEVGITRVPDPREADDLIASFNLPIDPYDPSPLLFLRDVEPGEHVIALEAPCYEPVRRTVAIPEGTDSTTMLPLSPETGELLVTGPVDAEVSIDGGPLARPPVLRTDLCPGPHLIEVDLGDGRSTGASVLVRAGRRVEWAVELAPVIALLRAPEHVREAMLDLRNFHVVLADGPSSPDPASLTSDDLSIPRAPLARVIAAWNASAVAWVDGSELYLVAAEATRAERMSLADGIEPVIAAVDVATPLYQRSVGVTLLDAAPFAHPLVAAVTEATTRAGRGIRVGDELLSVEGEEMRTATDLDVVLAAHELGKVLRARVRRPSGDAAVGLEVGQALGPLDFAARGVSPSAVVALLSFRPSTEGPAVEQAHRKIAVGKALLELADWERAYSNLAAIPIEVLDRNGAGLALYYRGVAAWLSGDRSAAQASLRTALQYPQARLLGPDGPRASILATPLLATIDDTPKVD